MALVVHLMGTVRLVRDGQQVDVGGPKQQAVLAALALSAGRRVSTDRLVDLVWDENPPASARRTVQSYVASLRRALGDGAALEPSQNGYTLDLERGSIDLLAFEDRAADLLADVGLGPDARAQGLADVLSTWETPMDGVRGGRLRELVAPLEELRLQAVEGLAVAQISGTGAGDAVRTLEALVREHPTRETLWLELANGLKRLGRRDAALNAIQRAREALREHLGVHPSALLSALETDLLTDDSTVSAPSIDDDADRGSSVQPAQVAPAGRPGNLPTPLSSFIGRTDEVGEIAQFLLGARLVTLRGLGGIGKTSLALKVAADCAAEFRDGVWFVDLAYVAPAPAAMPERFLAALGLRSKADADPLDQLLVQLRPLRTLLVIDNCERQVEEIAELLGQIVRIAPDLHVLATSRTSLAVAGEAVWQVEPLDLSTAVELFAERAQHVRKDFEVTDRNRDVVESICEKLDGIPLAIEFAAARLNVLSVDQILEHLDDRFELLSVLAPGQRDEERTLQAALEWSSALLDEHELGLLQRLTVFPAEFTLEAAKDICARDADTVGLVNSMGLLVEASLVVFEANDADPRYRLLETVREYAAAMLSTPEHDEVALRHANYYVDMAARIAVQQKVDYFGALQAVDRDLDNFRAAMACAFARDEPELGLSITRHLGTYFFSRHLNHEFLRWLQVGIEQADPETDERLLALGNALLAAYNSGNIEVADRLAIQVETGIDVARSPAVRARLLTCHAAHLTDIDPRTADVLLAEATELLKGIDPFAILSPIHNRLEIAWRTGDLPHAEAMAADLDDLPDRPIVRRERLLLQIQAAACAGDWEQVIDASHQHYGLDEEMSIGLLHFRAEALGALGRNGEAIATIDQIDELSRFEDLERSNSQILRATTELRGGDPARAKTLLAESAIAFGRDSDRVQRTYLASLAGVAAHLLDADETAALHFGHARAIREEFDVNLRMSERPLVDRAVRQCRATLGPDRFDDLANVGASSDWAGLVELLSST